MPQTASILIAGALIAGGVAFAASSKSKKTSAEAAEGPERDIGTLLEQNDWKTYLRMMVRVAKEALYVKWLISPDTTPRDLGIFEENAQRTQKTMQRIKEKQKKEEEKGEMTEEDAKMYANIELAEMFAHTAGLYSGYTYFQFLMEREACRYYLKAKKNNAEYRERLRNLDRGEQKEREEFEQDSQEAYTTAEARGFSRQQVVTDKVEQFLREAEDVEI